jgi:hypothetical protein
MLRGGLVWDCSGMAAAPKSRRRSKMFRRIACRFNGTEMRISLQDYSAKV